MTKNPDNKIPKQRKPESSQPDEKLDELMNLMEAEHLQELEVSEGDQQIKLVRESRVSHTVHPVYQPVVESSTEEADADVEEKIDGVPIKAPIAGIFYRSPSPKSPSFVKEGDDISPGQTLCIVEAMKVMNEIKAEQSGRITKISTENGKPVEAGQVLFILKPA